MSSHLLLSGPLDAKNEWPGRLKALVYADEQAT